MFIGIWSSHDERNLGLKYFFSQMYFLSIFFILAFFLFLQIFFWNFLFLSDLFVCISFQKIFRRNVFGFWKEECFFFKSGKNIISCFFKKKKKNKLFGKKRKAKNFFHFWMDLKDFFFFWNVKFKRKNEKLNFSIQQKKEQLTLNELHCCNRT